MSKTFRPQKGLLQLQKGYKNRTTEQLRTVFCTPIATEEGPFGAETFCSLKLYYVINTQDSFQIKLCSTVTALKRARAKMLAG